MDQIKEDLREIVMEYAGTGAGGAQIPYDADIRAWGVDSLGALELFAEIESRFGVCLTGDDFDLASMNTIEQIALLIQRKQSQAAGR